MVVITASVTAATRFVCDNQVLSLAAPDEPTTAALVRTHCCHSLGDRIAMVNLAVDGSTEFGSDIVCWTLPTGEKRSPEKEVTDEGAKHRP